jgi:hypothetical protein
MLFAARKTSLSLLLGIEVALAGLAQEGHLLLEIPAAAAHRQMHLELDFFAQGQRPVLCFGH